MLRVHALATAAVLLALAALPSAAQSRTAPSSTTSQSSSGSAGQTGSGQTGRARRQPCWQQAGVPQSVMQKRQQIQEDTRSQVESVCHDSSLSQQQKQEKIRQLRQEARKQMEALVTPQQMQAVESCRSQQRENRSSGGGQASGGGHRSGGVGSGGPCGEMPEGRGSRSPQSSPPADSEPDQQ
jgi:hypothetical protein